MCQYVSRKFWINVTKYLNTTTKIKKTIEENYIRGKLATYSLFNL